MTNRTMNLMLNPDLAAMIARERHRDLMLETAERRLAKSSRKATGRTRGRFLRWR